MSSSFKNTTVSGTDGAVLPVGSDAQRLTPSVGMTRMNNTASVIETYNGGGFGWTQGKQVASTFGTTSTNPAPNARSILKANPSAASGNYWIRGYNGVAMQVYCDMTGGTAGSSTGGWMRFDQALVSTYRGTAISDALNGYSYVSSGRYDRTGTDASFDGRLTGIRWDLGTSINFIGIRVTRFYFYSVNGPDGAGNYDGPTPGWGSSQPTDTHVTNFYNTNNAMGSNFTSFGLAIGNGSTGFANLARVYSGGGGIWTGEVNGGFVALTTTSFIQYDHSGINSGRYVYWYESDGNTEYDSPYEYTIWLR